MFLKTIFLHPGSKQTSVFHKTSSLLSHNKSDTLLPNKKKNNIHSAMIVVYFFWEHGVSLLNSVIYSASELVLWKTDFCFEPGHTSL